MKFNYSLQFLISIFFCFHSCTNTEHKPKITKEKTNSVTKKIDSKMSKRPIDVIDSPSIKEHKKHKLKSGDHLSNLAVKEYGEAHYSTIIETYNKTNNITSFKKGDTIYIPNINLLFEGNSQVSSIVDSVLKARTIFIKQEPILSKSNQIAITSEMSRYNNLNLSNLVSNDLHKAHLLIKYSIKSLENFKNETLLPPIKMINQLKQVSDLLKSLSEGKCDENGYDINMVHQRLVHALSNGMFWLNQ